MFIWTIIRMNLYREEQQRIKIFEEIKIQEQAYTIRSLKYEKSKKKKKKKKSQRKSPRDTKSKLHDAEGNSSPEIRKQRLIAKSCKSRANEDSNYSRGWINVLTNEDKFWINFISRGTRSACNSNRSPSPPFGRSFLLIRGHQHRIRLGRSRLPLLNIARWNETARWLIARP